MNPRHICIGVVLLGSLWDCVALAQAGGTPLGEVPVPTNGRVIRMSIAEMPASAQAFLAPQLKKYALESRNVAEITQARTRNAPRENLDASEGRVHYLDAYAKSATLDIKAIGPVSLHMVDLTGTPLSRLQFLGYVPEGTLVGGPYSWIARVFRSPEGNTIALSEWDFALDDGGVLQIEEFLNANVDQNPGALVRDANAALGRSLWNLTWVSGSTQFTLYVACVTADCPSADEVVAMGAAIPSRPTAMQPYLPK
jgi:hypothetical protein